MTDVFRDYMSLGGMPEVVKMFVDNGHYGGTLKLQRQLLKDYEEDITKYAKQTDKSKILAVYSHISTFLAKENKKYQISKIAKGARNREYFGAVEWLKCFASRATNSCISTSTIIPRLRWTSLSAMPIRWCQLR